MPIRPLAENVAIAPKPYHGAVGEEGFTFAMDASRMPCGSSPGTVSDSVGVGFMAPAGYGVVARGEDIKGCGHNPTFFVRKNLSHFSGACRS